MRCAIIGQIYETSGLTTMNVGVKIRHIHFERSDSDDNST
jgi:hypothetical protein